LLTSPHQQLSAASTALQKPRQAIPALQSLLALDPRDPADIHYRLAHCYHETDQPVRARRHVLQALEYAPRYRDAHRLLLKLGPTAPPVDQQSQEKP
jgi:tetratricopeptide (TPR) repeat protein